MPVGDPARPTLLMISGLGSQCINYRVEWCQQFAAEGFFGGVIASGMHSLAIYQRLAVLGAYRHWWVVAGRHYAPITDETISCASACRAARWSGPEKLSA